MTEPRLDQQTINLDAQVFDEAGRTIVAPQQVVLRVDCIDEVYELQPTRRPSTAQRELLEHRFPAE